MPGPVFYINIHLVDMLSEDTPLNLLVWRSQGIDVILINEQQVTTCKCHPFMNAHMRSYDWIQVLCNICDFMNEAHCHNQTSSQM